MKYLLMLFMMSGISSEILAQQSGGDTTLYQIYDVDSLPRYPGGEIEMMLYLRRHFQYPPESVWVGSVTLQFIVEKDGTLSTVQTAKKVSPALETELKRVCSTMPRWQPGIKNSAPVRTLFRAKWYIHLE